MYHEVHRAESSCYRLRVCSIVMCISSNCRCKSLSLCLTSSSPPSWDLYSSTSFGSRIKWDIMLNGSELHMHTIKDFKMSGSPTSTNNGNSYPVVTYIQWHSDRSHEGHAYIQCTNFHKTLVSCLPFCYQTVDRTN